MQISKKAGRGSLGQRWLPVCLWDTLQLALTVNAGKTTFPKLGKGDEGAEGWREEGEGGAVRGWRTQ